MNTSIIALVFYPFFSKNRKNALLLLFVLFLPIGGIYSYCQLLNITHFVTSRYVIDFLPLFFITIFMSLDNIETKLEILKKFVRLKFLFVILMVVFNLLILPLYYRSEKQDFRGLVRHLRDQLREGDYIILLIIAHSPGYFIILVYIQRVVITSSLIGESQKMKLNIELP